MPTICLLLALVAASSWAKPTESLKTEEVNNTMIEKFIKLQTKHLQEEIQHIKYETDRIKTESEHLRDETVYLKDETNHLKSAMEHYKNEADYIKDQTKHLKAEASYIQTETEFLKDLTGKEIYLRTSSASGETMRERRDVLTKEDIPVPVSPEVVLRKAKREIESNEDRAKSSSSYEDDDDSDDPNDPDNIPWW